MLAVASAGFAQLKPGDSTRTVPVEERERTYLVHVPPKYDAKARTPVVIALHGAWTNARLMELYSGLDKTADEKNFIVVYPNGTGPNEMTLFWNSGRRFNRPGRPKSMTRRSSAKCSTIWNRLRISTLSACLRQEFPTAA